MRVTGWVSRCAALILTVPCSAFPEDVLHSYPLLLCFKFPKVHDFARFSGRLVLNSPKCTTNPEDFADNGQNSPKCTIFSDFSANNRAKRRIWNNIWDFNRFLRAKQRIWLSETPNYYEIVQNSKFDSAKFQITAKSCKAANLAHRSLLMHLRVASELASSAHCGQLPANLQTRAGGQHPPRPASC
jgi:hypothetical protein